MAALTSAQHAGILMFLWIIGSLAAGVNGGQEPFSFLNMVMFDSIRGGGSALVFNFRKSSNDKLYLEKMKARPGQNVTLQCHTSTDTAITVLEWSRSELKQYVFYFRDNMLYESFQDPRYRGRVELKDPEMKNGHFTILLKNVSTSDTGTYHCRVISLSNNRRKRDEGVLVRSVHLSVSEGPEKQINDEHPGGPRGHVGLGVVLGVGLGVVCLIVVVVVAGLVVKSKRAKEKRPLESVDEKVNVKLNP